MSNTVYIAYSSIDQFDKNIIFSQKEKLSVIDINKISSLKKEDDKLRHIYGRLLLKEILFRHGIFFDYNKVLYSKYNRPYINECYDFNISHSGKYITCAISFSSKIGIDIEEIKNIDLDDYKIVLSEKEICKINLSKNILYDFYKIWVSKEAYLKCIGCGIIDDLKSIESDKLMDSITIPTFDPNYIMAIFCGNKSYELKLSYIDTFSHLDIFTI